MTILNLTVTAESKGGLDTKAKAVQHQLVMDEPVVAGGQDARLQSSAIGFDFTRRL